MLFTKQECPTSPSPTLAFSTNLHNALYLRIYVYCFEFFEVYVKFINTFKTVVFHNKNLKVGVEINSGFKKKFVFQISNRTDIIWFLNSFIFG